MATVNLQGLIDEVMGLLKRKKGGQNDIFGLNSEQERSREDSQLSDQRKFLSDEARSKDVRGRDAELQKQGMVNAGTANVENIRTTGEMARQSLMSNLSLEGEKYKANTQAGWENKRSEAVVEASGEKSGTPRDRLIASYIKTPNQTIPMDDFMKQVDQLYPAAGSPDPLHNKYQTDEPVASPSFNNAKAAETDLFSGSRPAAPRPVPALAPTPPAVPPSPGLADRPSAMGITVSPFRSTRETGAANTQQNDYFKQQETNSLNAIRDPKKRKEQESWLKQTYPGRW